MGHSTGLNLRVGFLLHKSKEVTQRRAQRDGKLFGCEDGRHALAALQQSDVVAVQPRLGGESLLGKPRRLSKSSEDGTKSSLERMHCLLSLLESS